jgi:hypothetical protein
MGNIESTYMLATLCAVVVNVVQSIFGKAGKHHTITAQDFIPDWGGESERSSSKSKTVRAQTVDEMKALFKQLAATKTKKRVLKAPPTKKRGQK